METFGNIKTRIVKQLTEAYLEKDNEQISKIIKLIKEDKDFLELYNLYETVEEKYFEDREIANAYVNAMGEYIVNKNFQIQETCNKFNNILTEDTVSENEVYDALDQLLVTTNAKNIDKKIIARKNIVDFITTEKPKEEKVDNFTLNENLLSTVLIDNFNSKFKDILDESEQEELKEIMSLTGEEIESKINELKENVDEKINNLINENEDKDLKERLNLTKQRINKMDSSRLSYYKIKQLEKDL